MKYRINLVIEDLCSLNICEIDIPKEERENAEVAFKCEMDYNGFDMKF